MANQFDSERQNPYSGILSVKLILDEREVALLAMEDIVYLDFKEDIFSYCLQGSLVFYDQYGLLEYGFTGNEMISIVYGTKETREIVFHIWQVNNIVSTQTVGATNTNQIQLMFVDASFYYTAIQKFSRSWPVNTKYSDVMKHLLQNMVGWETQNINIESSSNKLSESWVMPYCTVGQT